MLHLEEEKKTKTDYFVFSFSADLLCFSVDAVKMVLKCSKNTGTISNKFHSFIGSWIHMVPKRVDICNQVLSSTVLTVIATNYLLFNSPVCKGVGKQKKLV